MNMSPMKTARNGTPYYNLNVEAANNEMVRAVCFSPVKRPLMDHAEKKPNWCAYFQVVIPQRGCFENRQ